MFPIAAFDRCSGRDLIGSRTEKQNKTNKTNSWSNVSCQGIGNLSSTGVLLLRFLTYRMRRIVRIA